MPRETSAEKMKANGGGRPRKFSEPSRPITLTLPESTLAELQQIDADRSCAIVKLAKDAVAKDGRLRPLVEIVAMGAETGVVIVGPSRALRQIPFLRLVEVAPGRFLLALQAGNDFKALELAIHDVLGELTGEDKAERELITELLGQMRRLRKSQTTTMAEILLVTLDRKQSSG